MRNSFNAHNDKVRNDNHHQTRIHAIQSTKRKKLFLHKIPLHCLHYPNYAIQYISVVILNDLRCYNETIWFLVGRRQRVRVIIWPQDE